MRISQMAGPIALLAATVLGCMPSVPNEEDHLRSVFGSIESFQERFGRIPKDLEEVCVAEPGWCRLQPADEWLLDRWETPVRLVQSAPGYELRSAGADQRFATEDDVVFYSQSYMESARAIEGCYRLSDGRELQGMSEFKLSLSRSASGAFSIETREGERGDAFRAEWFPVARDSLKMRWIRADRGSTIGGHLIDGRIVTESGSATEITC